MRIITALTIALALVGCAETTGINSRVFDTPDSYGPAGRIDLNGGDGRTVKPLRTERAPTSPN